MFYWKGKIIFCKKITFYILDSYLVYFNGLMPVLQDNILTFKQKNKRLFKFFVWELSKIICNPLPKKPHFLKSYISLLTYLVNRTYFIDIYKRYQSLKDKKEEDKIVTVDNKEIKKEDYIKSYINSAYKYLLNYTHWTEEDFKNNVGFLEYDEIIAEFEKKRIRNNLNTLNILVTSLSSLFKKDYVSDYSRELEENLKELNDIGFDREGFRSAMLGVNDVRKS